jgi:hypothetical protein
MAKFDKDIPELTDEELAFEMIEITCDEMDSLTRAFTMINDLCKELAEEIAQNPVMPAEHEIN